MKKSLVFLLPLCAIIILSFVGFFYAPTISPSMQAPNILPETTQISPQISPNFPIDNAFSRITKKNFGLRVSPKNSPVSPEKFTGYHTGVDFETFPSEQEIDVGIHPICTGPLVLKKWATGYGGVIVQRCQITEQEVTVIYGHLKLESITATVGSMIDPSQTLGILGKGFGTETEGERKHLHLGIHRGPAITLLGYVPTTSQLHAWMDPMSYLDSQK